MTLKEAHEKLDEEYAKNKVVTIGNMEGHPPDSVRVAGALIKVSEMAKKECSYFTMRKIEI